MEIFYCESIKNKLQVGQREMFERDETERHLCRKYSIINENKRQH